MVSVVNFRVIFLGGGGARFGNGFVNIWWIRWCSFSVVFIRSMMKCNVRSVRNGNDYCCF